MSQLPMLRVDQLFTLGSTVLNIGGVLRPECLPFTVEGAGAMLRRCVAELPNFTPPSPSFFHFLIVGVEGWLAWSGSLRLQPWAARGQLAGIRVGDYFLQARQVDDRRLLGVFTDGILWHAELVDKPSG